MPPPICASCSSRRATRGRRSLCRSWSSATRETRRRAAEVAERIAKSAHLFEAANGRLVSPTLGNLRDAYDRLARFERHSGSKLNSLRRLMLFGSFVLHVHAVSRWSEREDHAPRPPILLDLFDGTLISVADASRATLRAAGDAIEGLIRSRFHEHVVAEYGTTGKQIEAGLPGSGLGERVEGLYRTYCDGGTEPSDALARAMAEDAIDREREAPIGSLIELGRRAGFLAPWSNQGRGGKLRKRYTATAEFLETLVAATVEPDDPAEFPEFLERLRDYFGVVVGRPEDDAVIRHTNLARRGVLASRRLDQRRGPAPQRRRVPRAAGRVGLRQGVRRRPHDGHHPTGRESLRWRRR